MSLFTLSQINTEVPLCRDLLGTIYTDSGGGEDSPGEGLSPHILLPLSWVPLLQSRTPPGTASAI